MEPTELYDDDKPVGRVLSRREMITLLGGAGASLIFGAAFTRIPLPQQTGTATPAGTALPSCVVRPEQTEGPYFVDQQLNRFDLRVEPSDGSVKEGTLLHLIFNVTSIADNTCMPLEGAQVDVWHCDALGVYSGVDDPGFSTVDDKWLRGYQVTDENGVAEFLTIYPGWYSGRTVHIHFKIRTEPESEVGYEFTSQLFFPEDVTDEVHAQPPYNEKGYRNRLNANDGIFSDGGDQLTLDVAETSEQAMADALATAEATAEPQAGYQAIFNIGLDLTDASVGASDSNGSGGGQGGGRPGSRP